MQKSQEKKLAGTFSQSAACCQVILILALFAPAFLAFQHFLFKPEISNARSFLKVVEVAEKPRPKELVKIHSIVKSQRPDMIDAEAWRVAEVILEESVKRRLDPMMVVAVIQVESGFQNNTVSPMGARGLMQIMPDTGKFLTETLSHEYGFHATAFRPESLDDPLLNIRLGVYYLHDLTKQFKNLNLALIAYNAGPSEIQNRLEKNLEFSDEYATAVLDAYQSYKQAKQPTF
jgi:soluble lytic murein transglycosylase-like protein